MGNAGEKEPSYVEIAGRRLSAQAESLAANECDQEAPQTRTEHDSPGPQVRLLESKSNYHPR